MATDKVFRELASRRMFTGLASSALPPAGYEYRKGKSFDDVVKACHKGLRDGMGKTEFEHECIASRLEALFKKVAPSQKERDKGEG